MREGHERFVFARDARQPGEVLRHAQRRVGRQARRGQAQLHVLAQAQRGHGLGAEHADQPVHVRRFLLQVGHAVIAAQLGALGGRGQRIAIAADAVDQVALFRLQACPDAALRHFIDLFRRRLARLGGQVQEVAIHVVDRTLDHLREAGVERTQWVARVGQPGGGRTGRMDAQLFHHLVGRRQNREHADGTGDGGRVGDHFIGRGADPVTARSGHVTHRDDHRFAGGARQFQFAADQFRAEGAAARRIDAQHDGLDRFVFACLADQTRGGQAADGARRSDAVADFTGGDDHADGVADMHGAQARQVIRVIDLAEVRAFRIFGAARHHELAQFIARFQAVDQLAIERQLAQVAASGRHQLGQLVDRLHDGAGRQLARLFHVRRVGGPQAVVQVAVRFGRRFGRAVGDERLGRALVRAHFQQVHRHAHFIERVAVVIAVAAKAFQHDAAHRVQEYLVGLGRHQVLALVVAGTPGRDFLARGTETFHAGRHFAQRCEAAALQLVEQDHHGADVLVLGRRVEHRQHVAQLHVFLDFAADIGQHRLAHAARGFLDQRALQVQHQGGLFRQGLGAAAKDGDQDGDDDQQENQVDDRAAGGVQRAPECAKAAAQRREGVE